MKRLSYLHAAVVFTILPLGVFSQDSRPSLTREAMRDPEVMQAFRTPRVWWLSDNTALIQESGALERLDPSTGKRSPYVDSEKAGAGLRATLKDGEEATLPGVPREFTRDGSKALYVINGDVFVLDVGASSVTRLTRSPESEENVHLSPDGMKVAYVREKNLYVAEAKSVSEKALTKDGGGTILNGTLSWVYWEEIFGRSDIGYWWSGDSKRIAFLRTDESMVSVQHYVDLSPWTPNVTTQRYPKVGEPNPVVTVGVVDVSSAATVWAGIEPSAYEYVIRVDWLPDNSRLCVRTLNRAQTRLDFRIVEAATGASTLIMTDENEGWINMSDDLYFLKDGKHFVASSERDGYEHLYRFTMGGKLVNQITKGPWSIRSSGSGPFWVRQAVSGIDEVGGWVYFCGLRESSLEKHLYKVRLDGSKLSKITEEPGTHVISMSPDTRWFFDRHSNIMTPSSLSLQTTDGSKRSVLAPARKEVFAKYSVVYPELLWVSTRDGFKVPAWIVRPPETDRSRKLPVIVQVYGGPSAPTVSNSFGMDLISANDMLHQGYVTFKVDNRAATGISKNLENMLHLRSPGEVELNDLVDAVQWLKKQPGIDPDRFGITGWSGGGTNTLLAMTRSSEFKAGIAGGSVTDFRYYDTKWGEALMMTERENKEGYERVSLLKYAKDLHGRLLMIHGSHDDNVHIQNILQFVDELVKANKLFELMVYPMRGHGVGDPAGRRHMQNLMMDFWKRNL